MSDPFPPGGENVTRAREQEILAAAGCPGKNQWSPEGLWAHAEAQLLMFEEYLGSLPEDARYAAAGAQSPPVDQWRKVAMHAALLYEQAFGHPKPARRSSGDHAQ